MIPDDNEENSVYLIFIYFGLSYLYFKNINYKSRQLVNIF